VCGGIAAVAVIVDVAAVAAATVCARTAILTLPSLRRTLEDRVDITSDNANAKS